MDDITLRSANHWLDHSQLQLDKLSQLETTVLTFSLYCCSPVVGFWCGYLSRRGADLHRAQLMPLPLTVSCFSKIHVGSGTGSPG